MSHGSKKRVDCHMRIWNQQVTWPNHEKWKSSSDMWDLCWQLTWVCDLVETRWEREPKKQDGTQHTLKNTICGVGSCALQVKSLLRYRAHWWYQGPQFTTACWVSYVYSVLVAISIPSVYVLFMPGFSFSLLSRKGERGRNTDKQNTERYEN